MGVEFETKPNARIFAQMVTAVARLCFECATVERDLYRPHYNGLCQILLSSSRGILLTDETAFLLVFVSRQLLGNFDPN